MHDAVNKQFLDENNVRFLIQVQEDTGSVLFADRLRYLNQAADIRQ